MREWYYSQGTQCGPVDEKKLFLLLESNELAAATLVWTGGMKKWRFASEISPFKSIFETTREGNNWLTWGNFIKSAVTLAVLRLVSDWNTGLVTFPKFAFFRNHSGFEIIFFAVSFVLVTAFTWIVRRFRNRNASSLKAQPSPPSIDNH